MLYEYLYCDGVSDRIQFVVSVSKVTVVECWSFSQGIFATLFTVDTRRRIYNIILCVTIRSMSCMLMNPVLRLTVMKMMECCLDHCDVLCYVIHVCTSTIILITVHYWTFTFPSLCFHACVYCWTTTSPPPQTRPLYKFIQVTYTI